MSKLAALLTTGAVALGAATLAVAYAPLDDVIRTGQSIVLGQEDCKEGEKWNEETQKCEAENS